MKTVNNSTIQQWEAEGKDFLLIDVREDYEREDFHIGGKHIPMEDVVRLVNEYPVGKPIVMYCKRGIRSAICIRRLAIKRPELDLYNFENGILNLKS